MKLSLLSDDSVQTDSVVSVLTQLLGSDLHLSNMTHYAKISHFIRIHHLTHTDYNILSSCDAEIKLRINISRMY